MTKLDRSQYIKVRKEGGTTILSLGRLIPEGWKIVKLTKVGELPDKVVTVQIEKVA